MKSLCVIAFVGWFSLSSLLAAESAPAGGNLFQAIREGDRSAVEALLKSGSDVNVRDELGNTPLMAAALNADSAMLELLLRAGADVNATNKAGATRAPARRDLRGQGPIACGQGRQRPRPLTVWEHRPDPGRPQAGEQSGCSIPSGPRIRSECHQRPGLDRPHGCCRRSGHGLGAGCCSTAARIWRPNR